MLIREVTTPDDKLRLLKTIIDNSWSAMSAEVAAEKLAQQQRAAAAARRRPRRTPSTKPKRGADASTAPTTQKNAPQQAQASTAEKTAAQLVLKGQTAANGQQGQKRGSYPTKAQPKPQLYAPPKPLARYGKVVREPIR